MANWGKQLIIGKCYGREVAGKVHKMEQLQQIPKSDGYISKLWNDFITETETIC